MDLYEYCQSDAVDEIDPTGLTCKPKLVSGVSRSQVWHDWGTAQPNLNPKVKLHLELRASAMAFDTGIDWSIGGILQAIPPPDPRDNGVRGMAVVANFSNNMTLTCEDDCTIYRRGPSQIPSRNCDIKKADRPRWNSNLYLGVANDWEVSYSQANSCIDITIRAHGYGLLSEQAIIGNGMRLVGDIFTGPNHLSVGFRAVSGFSADQHGHVETWESTSYRNFGTWRWCCRKVH